MLVVVDSNALIGLAKGQAIHVLGDLFQSVHLPQSIYDEVAVQGVGRPGADELAAAKGGWAQIEPNPTVTEPEVRMMRGANDRHVVQLAADLKADLVISDDAEVRKVATALGLTVIATADVVGLARRRGLVSSCKTILDAMIAAQFGIEQSVYDRVLQAADEPTTQGPTGGPTPP